jgi:hypothetical protein
MNARDNLAEKQFLTQLFERHVPYLLDVVKTSLKMAIPIPDISIIQTLCGLLDALLPEKQLGGDLVKETYEICFHFACIWAFGGPLLHDQVKKKKKRSKKIEKNWKKIEKNWKKIGKKIEKKLKKLNSMKENSKKTFRKLIKFFKNSSKN